MRTPLGEPLEVRIVRSLGRINDGVREDGWGAEMTAQELHGLAWDLFLAGFMLPVPVHPRIYDLACMLMPDMDSELGGWLSAILTHHEDPLVH